MKNLSLAEKFAVMGLNAKSSNHKSTEKTSVLILLAVAHYLDKNYDEELERYRLDINELKNYVKNVPLKKLEQAIVKKLKAKGLIKEVHSLLSCDLFYSDNINLFEYLSDKMTFDGEIDLLRAEFFEPGPISDESIILMWLLKESLCMNDLFSPTEIKEINARLDQLSENHTLLNQLMTTNFQSIWRTFVKGFLQTKANFFITPIGRGLAYIYPALQRDESIFIETEAYFSGAQKRLEDVLERISSKGYSYEILRSGAVPLVRIGNIKYELVPDAVNIKFPIHGVRLRRYH